jgi:CRISPR-associated protein Csd1
MLEELVELYEELCKQGKVLPEGWGMAKVSHKIELDKEGHCKKIISAKEKVKVKNGKKEVEIAPTRKVPLPVIRTISVKANFLCDTPTYLLGVAKDGNKERANECFQAARKLHHKILDHCPAEEAKAILAYFDTWDYEHAETDPMIQERIEELASANNLIFTVDGKDTTTNPDIEEAWDNYLTTSKETAKDTIKGQCLITGKRNQPIAILHPKIKGVAGAKTTGANLVSFNAPAFWSYGKDKKQGENSPISEHAAFAYGTALNQLLADRRHTQVIGDTTVVYWSKHAITAAQDVIAARLGNVGKSEIHNWDEIAEQIKKGLTVNIDEETLNQNEPFYILGLTPNASRIAVRFFEENRFGEVLQNLEAHQKRMELQGPDWEKGEIPLWKILKETTNPNAKESCASPLMAGSLLRAILENTKYPESVYHQVLMRVFKDQEISHTKAAFIKAYLLKNATKHWEEKLQMAVNKETKEISYVLGRLFSVLEDIQQNAIPEINATIKKRYFNSACTTPAAVFPILLKLTNSHIGKFEKPKGIYFKKKLSALMDQIEMPNSGMPFPKRLNLEEQGAFVLGYYQETQAKYVKKQEEK